MNFQNRAPPIVPSPKKATPKNTNLNLFKERILIMKKFAKLKRIAAMVSAVCLSVGMLATASFAATVPEATIDTSRKANFTLYKYDFTNAQKDGVWNEDSFVSTGYQESYVEETLGGTERKGTQTGLSSNLGNGQQSNGYAISGVEYTILKVAEITTFTESARDGHDDYNLTQVLYGFNKVKAANLLSAIGLADGAQRYTNADVLDSGKATYYYQSDVLNKALAAALENNSTTVKDALEAYMADQGGMAMPKTNENGMSTVSDLDLGLYLVVETKVPEMVTSTTNPFFVSLPMTTVSGNEHSDSPEGGHEWNYDVYVYPKNETGIPTLEKTVRESKDDTGANNASDVITDGYKHTATGSAGDVMEYQIISTLPTITSNATNLTTYNFYDKIAVGLVYKQNEVKIEIFKDKTCTDKVTTWNVSDGKFTVQYTSLSNECTMTVDITAAGLAEINGSQANENGELYSSYSNYTMRITYSAVIASDSRTIFGDGQDADGYEDGNCNKVVLTWKRTSGEYYDTLIDDCHVYTYGINLTKLFSDEESNTAKATELFKHVKFKVWNDTDKYWVKADLNTTEGIYYVTDHVDTEEEATIFTPVTVAAASPVEYGRIVIKGLEDDTYIITEIETADGYTLLKDDITVVISTAEDKTCDIYGEDELGVLQNDPRYAFGDVPLANIPQVQLAHKLLTASATVDGNKVSMLADAGSENAIVPLTVVNTPGFDLPQTGEQGMWLFTLIGVSAMVGSLLVILLVGKKKNEKETETE